MDLLGIPRNDFKDAQGTAVMVLDIKVDTSYFPVRLSKMKLDKATKATVKVLSQKSVSFIDI